jgi:hypothetical protein
MARKRLSVNASVICSNVASENALSGFHRTLTEGVTITHRS